MKLRAILAAAAFVAFAGVAGAATITPLQADCDPNVADYLGSATACGGSGRTDAAAVNLGAADGSFYSLGLGGSAIWEISPVFTGPISVIEVTWGGAARSGHFEAAQVLLRAVGATSFTVAGLIDNTGSSGQTNSSTIIANGQYDAIGFIDQTRLSFPGSNSTDGFDIDAVSISPVPLPASAALLALGVGGLAALRRRKTA